MERIVQFAIVGFIAQMIDGSMGMGYGVTSATLLIAAGYAPAAVSASIHLAKIFTGLVSAGAHWRFGNVDRHIVLPLGLGGGVGAFAGAVFLTSIPVLEARIVVAVLLIALGSAILVRFVRHAGRERQHPHRFSWRFLMPLGLAGGFVDGTGGGGWGTVTTSSLLSRSGSDPKKVVGSVSTSEIIVAISATAGFLLSLGFHGMNPTFFLPLVIGGVFAAAPSAWLVRHMPTRQLGILIAGVILLTNARTLLQIGGATAGVSLAVYAAIIVAWFIAFFWAVARRRERQARLAGNNPLPVHLPAEASFSAER